MCRYDYGVAASTAITSTALAVVDTFCDRGSVAIDAAIVVFELGMLDAAVATTTTMTSNVVMNTTHITCTVTVAANDFAALFSDQPKISLVCFNGQTAAKLYGRFVAPTLEKGSNTPDYQTLPSTSPAYASMSFEEKLDRWEIVQTAATIRRKK